MIEREINFVVGQDGKVTCDGSLRPQLAGVQGDRNECTLNFDLTAIYNGNFNYFIEFVSGSGVPYMLSTDSEGVSWNLANHTLSVLLGAEITADGGQVEVNIVEEKIDSENETAIEGNTYTTYIYFEPKSGAIQKLRNTAYGIFFDIKIKVAEFTSSITQAFSNFTSSISSEVSNLENSVNTLDEKKQDNLNLGDGLEFVDDYDEQAEPIKVLKAKVDGHTVIFDGAGDLAVDTDIIATKAFVRAVNDLANYYLKSETYTKTEVNQLIGAIPKFKIEVVNQLPTADISTATVYLVRTGAESQNLYTEYIYVNNAWEKLGTQTVDLTGYATQTWVNSQIADFLTANEISYAISTALNNYYNKSEIDGLLEGKVNIGTFNDLADEVGNLEYNDIFNIRVEWDRQYMSLFELIRISFQYYDSGILIQDTVSYNVKDITNGNVYLYKNTGDSWQIAVGTPPSSSSYNRTPMLIGHIATKTVNGESVKLFFRNGDDETQFDKLNSEKVDKQNMSLLCSRTVIDTGETLPYYYTFSQDDNGNAFNLSMAQVVVYVPSGANQAGSIGFYTNSNRTGPIYKYTINNIRQVSANSWFDIKTEIKNGFWTSTPKGTSAVYLSTGAPKTELTAGSYKIKSIDVTAWGSSTKVIDWDVNTNYWKEGITISTSVADCITVTKASGQNLIGSSNNNLVGYDGLSFSVTPNSGNEKTTLEVQVGDKTATFAIGSGTTNCTLKFADYGITPNSSMYIYIRATGGDASNLTISDIYGYKGSSVIPVGSVIKIYGINEVTA